MPGFNHVLLTRFNLPTPGLESLIRARDGWLRERIELFERYCAPSVAHQTHEDLDWLVYFDPESPQWLVERLRPLVDRGLFRPVYRSTVSMEDLVSDIGETVRAKEEVLVTTNLDNDDGLAVDFCERLATVRMNHPRAVLYFARGLVVNPDGLHLLTDRRNAFVSVWESWDSPVTSWSEYHNEFARIMPAIELEGRPGWLQVVHGSNVSNRVRGRLVSPHGFSALFGEMLDDVAEPSLFELGKDLLILNPARMLRDRSRATARRFALMLLGKERYGQAKLRLRAIRRTT